MEEVPIQQVSIILIRLELKDTCYGNVMSCPGNIWRKKKRWNRTNDAYGMPQTHTYENSCRNEHEDCIH